MQDAPRVFTDSTAGSEVARLHCVMIKWNLILERLQLPDHLYTDRLRCHIPRPGPVSLRVSELEVRQVDEPGSPASVDDGLELDAALGCDQPKRALSQK